MLITAILATAILAAPAPQGGNPGAVGAAPRTSPGVKNDCPCREKTFLLGFAYSHVYSEDGDLARPGSAPRAAGVEFAFAPAASVVQHLGLSHQWQDQQGVNGSPSVTRRGFRVDLVSLGFPIRWSLPEVQLAMEPMVRILRGEILWESSGGMASKSHVNLESGFGLRLAASARRWFLAFEPLSIDFRWFTVADGKSEGGFSRLWSWMVVGGREF